MIDFKKIDLKRSPETNQKIIQWFEYLINTPEIGSLIDFYYQQGFLLYIEKCNGLLRFYGNDVYLDHHSSNIEYVIKFLCHKILHDNGKNKILLDYNTLTWARWGFSRLIYIDEFNQHRTDVVCHKFTLCIRQVQILRGILRMINGKDPGLELTKFENSFNYCQQKVYEFSELSFLNMENYINFRQLTHYQIKWSSWWENKKLQQWFYAERILS